MNKQPIEMARDADLRLSQPALQRAAQRARELAVQTGTAIVVSHLGVLEQINPKAEMVAQCVQEPVKPYGDKP